MAQTEDCIPCDHHSSPGDLVGSLRYALPNGTDPLIQGIRPEAHLCGLTTSLAFLCCFPQVVEATKFII